LPTNLDQKQNAPPTFSMEKEGGACKGLLRTTTKEGIAITNLTKNNPTHPLNYRGWVGQLIIIKKYNISFSSI